MEDLYEIFQEYFHNKITLFELNRILCERQEKYRTLKGV